MNNIYASRMQKLASQELAEAQKVISIKIGEGEAERKALLGVGTARQRAAIASGLEATIGTFSKVCPASTTPRPVPSPPILSDTSVFSSIFSSTHEKPVEP